MSVFAPKQLSVPFKAFFKSKVSNYKVQSLNLDKHCAPNRKLFQFPNQVRRIFIGVLKILNSKLELDKLCYASKSANSLALNLETEGKREKVHLIPEKFKRESSNFNFTSVESIELLLKNLRFNRKFRF